MEKVLRSALLLLSALLCLPVTACGGEDAGDRAQAIASLSGNASAGETFFGQQCVVCHDANAMGVPGLGSDLTVTVPMLTDAELAQTFLTPPDGMTSFAQEDNQTLANIIAYLRTL